MARAFLLPILLLWLVTTGVGCATHTDRVRQIHSSFYRDDFGQAQLELAEAAEKWDATGSKSLLELDQAMIDLFSGNPATAEKRLIAVRDEFQIAEEKAIHEQVGSLLADDNRIAYQGEDYEKILIPVMLAISSLLNDGQDALAYAHQIAQEQERLNQPVIASTSPAEISSEQTPTQPTSSQAATSQSTSLGMTTPVTLPLSVATNAPTTAANAEHLPEVPSTSQLAISPYLRGVLREKSHRDYHEAKRLYEQAALLAPGFTQLDRDIDRVTHGRHSQRGNGVLYVITFVGMGPYKEEVAHAPSSDALLIADQIFSALGKHSLPPTIAPVKVPLLMLHDNPVDQIYVSAGGQQAFTETIVDVGKLAQQTYAQDFPRIVAKAVVRRAVKKGVVYQTKEISGVQSMWGELALNAVGVIWEASESADTRCWGLLPDRIQLARLELPAGEHQVMLQSVLYNQSAGQPSYAQVFIRDGMNTYLLANYPDRQRIGDVVVSQE